jgi:hypothetical protein
MAPSSFCGVTVTATLSWEDTCGLPSSTATIVTVWTLVSAALAGDSKSRTSGLATQEQFDEWRKGLDRWRDHPGACGGFAFGHVIGSKPG